VDWIANLALPSLSMAQLLQRIVAVSVVIGVHGWAIAWGSERLGDPGPRRDGRRTPNPLVHLDLVGFIHGLFFRVAWMQRLDIDPSKLRGGHAGALLVTVGASVLLIAVSASLWTIRPLLLSVLRDTAALTVTALLAATADLAIIAAVYHLVPLPPFVGAAFVPVKGRWADLWTSDRLRWIAVGTIVLLSLAGVTGRFATSITQTWRAWVGF
jgi:hypothetical protein